MNDVLMVILAISGAGFGLGLCGVALITFVARQEDRDPAAPAPRV